MRTRQAAWTVAVSRLTLSGLVIENRAVHRFALLRMFGPSPQAALVKHLQTTMACADLCSLTPSITARRAACADGSLPVRSQSDRAARSRARSFRVRHHQGRFSPSTSRRQSPQISRRQMSELSVHKRRIYRRLRTGGLCRHAPAWPLHPSALYAVSVHASQLLHPGFLRTIHRGLALAFGSWLSVAAR